MKTSFPLAATALAALTLLTAPVPAADQGFNATPSPVALEAMKKVDFLAGEWEGDATVDMGPRGKLAVRQTEVVKRHLGGLALAIEGRGYTKDAAGVETLAFEAYGTLSYDLNSGKYRLMAVKAPGEVVDPEVTMMDKGFVWSFPTKYGRMRYTLRLTPEGRWHEVGEMSPDGGTTWMKTVEMTLKRK
ncbi:MAG: hypothetical protein JNK60_02440 [Acidobacteria bacterium]|nr:hypothetical protein [Acidobacteriota bacterium]